MNNTLLNSLKVAGISIVVAVLGGIIQALSNFHPSDQITAFFMTVFGGAIIGLLNQAMHKMQGTTVVTSNTVLTTPEVITTQPLSSQKVD